MSDAAGVRLWPALTMRDADLMRRWLAAVGFTEHAVHLDDDDPAVVVHGEWLWPGGGGIMGGSERPGAAASPVGAAAAYLVTPDPDAVFRAALDAGGSVVREVVDQPYGGRGGTVADPEGNLWSVGDYQPA